MTTLLPSFRLSLPTPAHTQITTAYSESEAQLIYVSGSGDSLALFAPQFANTLVFHKQINAIGSISDKVILASQSTLQAFDFRRNCDVFYREQLDANVILIRRLNDQIIVANNNCSLSAIDLSGNELLSYSTERNIDDLCVMESKIVVVCLDEIRVLSADKLDLVNKWTHPFSILKLETIDANQFAFKTGNSFGLMDLNGKLIWQNNVIVNSLRKASEKLLAISTQDELQFYSLNGQLITRVSIEEILSLELVNWQSPNKEFDTLLAVTMKEVYGFTSSSLQNLVVDSNKQLNDLLLEKKRLEQQLEQFKQKPQSGAMTKLSYQIKQDDSLFIQCNNDSVIKMCLLSGPCFENDTLIVNRQPNQYSPFLSVPLPQSNCQIQIQTIVGHRKLDIQDVVFEHTMNLSFYSRLVMVPVKQMPLSTVTFTVNERLNRLVLWAGSIFQIDEKQFMPIENGVRIGFANNKNSSNSEIVLALVFVTEQQSLTRVTIHCDDIVNCTLIVNDISAYLKLNSLAVKCDFPRLFEEFENQTISVIQECQAIKLKQTSEIGTGNEEIKHWLIRCEDSRIQNEFEDLTRYLSKLSTVNLNLVGEYNKRKANHLNLVDALKRVSLMIQQTCSLRIGPPKDQLMQTARQKIKQNNLPQLTNLFRLGVSPAGIT